jgi:hypothetical protein
MQKKINHDSTPSRNLQAQRRAIPPNQGQKRADIRAVIFPGQRKP